MAGAASIKGASQGKSLTSHQGVACKPGYSPPWRATYWSPTSKGRALSSSSSVASGPYARTSARQVSRNWAQNCPKRGGGSRPTLASTRCQKAASRFA